MSIANWNPADFGPPPKPIPKLDGQSNARQPGDSTPLGDNDELDSDESEQSSRNEFRKTGEAKPLHRLAAVRKQQGVSQRNMARRLNIDITTLTQIEEGAVDLPLTMLYAWQRVLDVPIAELLVDDDAPLSSPVYERRG